LDGVLGQSNRSNSLSQQFFQHSFPGGLTLIAEQMPAVQSAAMAILLPAGASTDPAGKLGSATVLSDLVLRGAGKRDSRTLTDYLDSLGLQRSSSVSVHHSRFACAAMAPKVLESIATYADIIQRPHMPESGFESARDLALQAIAGIEDDPRQKLLIQLRQTFLPSPLGRNPMGSAKDLGEMELGDCRGDWQRRYQADGAIFAVAGNIDFAQVRDEVTRHFGKFPASSMGNVELLAPSSNVRHEKQKSEQTHIGIAYPSVPETDPDYYVVRAAMEVLGGGMSGRLFTEVREKRGLCYSVWAGYTSVKHLGAVLGYAGSSNERAQATLDCIIEQIHRLSEGVTAAELERAKIGLKAGTIMTGESTSARAGAIAHDYFLRGRIRTLGEIEKEINQVTVERTNAFLKGHPPGPFTVVTVGPKALKTKGIA
jgi:predicted Zn-dependent peptidase